MQKKLFSVFFVFGRISEKSWKSSERSWKILVECWNEVGILCVFSSCNRGWFEVLKWRRRVSDDKNLTILTIPTTNFACL